MVSLAKSFCGHLLETTIQRFKPEQALMSGTAYTKICNLVNHGGVVQVLVVDSDRNRISLTAKRTLLGFDSAHSVRF